MNKDVNRNDSLWSEHKLWLLTVEACAFFRARLLTCRLCCVAHLNFVLRYTLHTMCISCDISFWRTSVTHHYAGGKQCGEGIPHLEPCFFFVVCFVVLLSRISNKISFDVMLINVSEFSFAQQGRIFCAIYITRYFISVIQSSWQRFSTLVKLQIKEEHENNINFASTNCKSMS